MINQPNKNKIILIYIISISGYSKLNKKKENFIPTLCKYIQRTNENKKI